MKVNNSSVNPASVQSSQTQAVDSKKIDKKGAKVSATEVSTADLGSSSKVNMSDRAQAMKKAKAIASDNSIDEAKVAKFQALIDSGNYKVDAEKVADRLVDDHMSIEN